MKRILPLLLLAHCPRRGWRRVVGPGLMTLVATSSCAVVRPIIASNGDLADARQVKLARAEGDRLSRMHEYLEHRPHGEWAAEFRAAFDAEEPAFYLSATKSRSAAIDYLAWLPRGPHAEAAFALVRSFDEPVAETEEARMLKAAQENEKRLERLAQERQDAKDGVLEASSVLVDPVNYGRPVEQSPELARFMLGGLNMGRTPTKRTRVLSFTIPSKNGPLPRTLEFTVTLTKGDGEKVTGAVIDGPDLFQRWAEASLVREVSPSEAEGFVRDAVTTLARGKMDVVLSNNLVTFAKK
jgi:hypothetical protein